MEYGNTARDSRFGSGWDDGVVCGSSVVVVCEDGDRHSWNSSSISSSSVGNC